jgi:hypothetical protein
MSEAFSGCGRLREADLSKTDLHSVTKMASVFEGCASLSKLNLSGLRDACVGEMRRCFMGCSSLTALDLSGVTVRIYGPDYIHFTDNDIDGWFLGCSSLKTLRLPEVHDYRIRKSIDSFRRLFDGCGLLERWEAPASWSWPFGDFGAIPKPTADCGKWWSVRDRRWMAVEEIRRRGPVADTYTSEPQGKGH